MDADVIIGVPDSATEMAEGFSTEVSGNSSDKLIYRRHDVRSFIKNSKAEIQKALNLKFSFSTKEIRGQRVIVIDDSIVRGHTSKKIVQALKDRGAKEVHFISGSPKITGGCKYGINLENEDLIATDRNDDEICAEIGADSVTYLSMESFKEVFRKHGVDPNDFCFACMDGNYW
jgi:amidophosphoribosyltransferase